MSDRYYQDEHVAAAYDAEQAGRQITIDDIPFYVGLAREAADRGEAVLELGCGTGRVTLPIAEAGVRVTGLDASEEMLTVALRKSGGRDNPRWVQADMASFELPDRFGLTIIPFRSFLLLLTVAEQRACLERVHAHLVDGGWLALNIFNPNLAAIAEWMNLSQDKRVRVDAGKGIERWASRHYSPAEQTLYEERFDELLNDDNAVISRIQHNLRLRYVFHYEMEHLLALSGFEVEALYGWFDRRPFDDDSDEMVWIARKR